MLPLASGPETRTTATPARPAWLASAKMLGFMDAICRPF
jgi:hypothetical protein